MKRRTNSNFKTASARNCSHYIGRFRHRRAPVDMKSMLGETRKSVHFFTWPRRGDVTKAKFPAKQANRNLKGALCKNVLIISAGFFIGRSAMSTRTGGASLPDPNAGELYYKYYCYNMYARIDRSRQPESMSRSPSRMSRSQSRGSSPRKGLRSPPRSPPKTGGFQAPKTAKETDTGCVIRETDTLMSGRLGFVPCRGL